MSDTRTQLLGRKRDLIESLRILEQDSDDGDIDQGAYQRTRERYEREAALVLERLDACGSEDPVAAPKRESPKWLRLGLPLAIVAAAVVIFLISSLSGRTSNESITGLQPGVVGAGVVAPPAVVAAEHAVTAHPGSVDALLALGNAYMTAGDGASAQRVFGQLMRVKPADPRAPTLEALILAASNRYQRALSLLASVEARDPAYARAWLTDGLVSSRRRQTLGRAIHVFRRFLTLQPKGRIAADVRVSLARLERLAGSR